MREMPKQKAKHTPGPWTYFVGNANGRGLIRIEQYGTGEHITSLARGAIGEANAGRIVACVNACEGMNTETLEVAANGGPNVKEWFQAWGEEFKIEKQRDELLAALEGLLNALPSATTHPAIMAAHTAIANAKKSC